VSENSETPLDRLIRSCPFTLRPTLLEQWLWDQNVSASAERVFWLHFRLGRMAGDWCSHISLGRVAEECRCDESTVTRAYQRLTHLGLIHRPDAPRDPRDPFRQLSPVTQVILPPELAAELDRGGVRAARGPLARAPEVVPPGAIATGGECLDEPKTGVTERPREVPVKSSHRGEGGGKSLRQAPQRSAAEVLGTDAETHAVADQTPPGNPCRPNSRDCARAGLRPEFLVEPARSGEQLRAKIEADTIEPPSPQAGTATGSKDAEPFAGLTLRQSVHHLGELLSRMSPAERSHYARAFQDRRSGMSFDADTGLTPVEQHEVLAVLHRLAREPSNPNPKIEVHPGFESKGRETGRAQMAAGPRAIAELIASRGPLCGNSSGPMDCAGARKLSRIALARLQQQLPRALGNARGETAAQLLREITWSAERGALKRFEEPLAVNVALKKVRERLWTRPHDMPNDWPGASTESCIAA
jgi:hypothetical protein